MPQDYLQTPSQLRKFIQELNEANPTLSLEVPDICHVHIGYLPISNQHRSNGQVRLQRTTRIHDHNQTDGIENLITVTGVKYTMARQAADAAVDLTQEKLGFIIPCSTAQKNACWRRDGKFLMSF